ncbi:MAG: N-acetylmuramoyl-L-alanine amidase, partial [Muribaculaceae bacterium]|nr:N-acetylmuramoyl-L-alanine amidase [Muribaculaceae bacterium]
VKQAGFWVLWSTSMPSVLVELDFICNPTSEKFMASADGVDKMATSLFKAFDDYYTVVTGSGGTLLPVAAGSVNPAAKTPSQAPAVPTVSRSEDMAQDMQQEDDGASTGVEYRVQVMANDRALSANSARFKGEKVNEYYDKGMYKYTVGHFKSRNEALACMRRLRAKFPQAFVVKMEDGRRVD